MKRYLVKRIRCNNRGVNLVEIILVIALFLLVISLGGPSLKSGKQHTNVKSAVMLLAEDLKSARQKAIDTQKPVALVIPSNNGTRAISCGYYIIEGYDEPIITKSVNWKDVYPSTYIFTGFWELTSGDNTTAQPDPQANDFPFDLQKWGGTGKDYVILFTPRGTVKTNGLPNFDNNFHLVVTKGITYSMTTAPSAGEFTTAFDRGLWDDGMDYAFDNPGSFGKIEKAWAPSHTVTITPLADVSINDGILKWKGTFERGEVARNTVTNPVTPPVVPARQANSSPEILEVEVLPHPNPHTLPAGANGTCPPNKHNSIIVKAKDTDGDELFTRIKCNTVGSAPGGWGVSISENVDTVMERTELEKNTALNPVPDYFVRKPSNDVETHVLSTDWQPPASSNPGDRYEVEIEVKDKRGGKDTAKIVLEVLPNEFIVFTRSPSGEGHGIYIMNSDGTGATKVADGMYSGTMVNGRKIVVGSDVDKSLYIMNYDGTGEKKLIECAGTPWYVTFSPDGTKILYSIQKEERMRIIYMINSDGTGNRVLTEMSPDIETEYPCWSRDGKKMCYVYHDYSSSPSEWKILKTDLTDETTETVLVSSVKLLDIAWSPDGSEIAVTSPESPYYGITIIDANTGAILRKISQNVNDKRPAWSPDGSKIVFNSYLDGYFQVFVIDSSDGGNKRQLTTDNSRNWYPRFGRY